MFHNISYSSILSFVIGVVFIAFYLYFKKKNFKGGDDDLLLLCGIGLLVISLCFHFFND